MFLFWNVCSQLEQRGCGWVIAKGKCYILMEAVRRAILLKHISFAFFSPNFSITSELGRNIDVTYVIFTCVHSHINYCLYLKALWLNTVASIHLKTFFFTINSLRSLSPTVYWVYDTSVVHIWAGPRRSRSNNSIVATIFASFRPSYSENATNRLPLGGLPWIFTLDNYIKINQDIQGLLKSDRNKGIIYMRPT